MMHGYKKHRNGTEYICEVGNLYGSPRAGRNWYKTLVKWLLDLRLRAVRLGPVLLQAPPKRQVPAHVWVDDIISFCDSDDLYNDFATAFFGKFKGTAGCTLIAKF
eukprot:3668951-Prymnesium_polylepis.1